MHYAKNKQVKSLSNHKKCTRKNVGSGYSTLAVNPLKFQDLGAVPIGVPLANLDDGSGIESTLWKNEAYWHKSCFNSCSEMKLERAKKRKIETEG